MSIRRRSHVPVIVTGCFLTTVGLAACSTRSSSTQSGSTTAASSASASAAPAKVAKQRADLHEIMEGRRKPRFAATDSLYDAAYDAWQIFIYLSSPVTDTTHRASPTFNKDKYPQSRDVLLWQTFAHRTELRPHGPLKAFDTLSKPDYSLAYDPADPPQRGDPDARFDLWNNLDEDNEINSCQVFGQYGLQPKPAGDKTFVLYEAKANGVEYEYVRSQFPDQDNPQGSLWSAETATTQYIQGSNAGGYDDCNCPKSSTKTVCLPCTSSTLDAPAFDGAMEVKAAWRKLLPNEDPTRYYITKAIYYKTDKNGSIKYYNDDFALIGLHIIMKLKSAPHFVFMTFEQIDEETADYRYVESGLAISDDNAVSIRRQGPSPNTDRKTNHAIASDIQQANTLFQDLTTGSLLHYYQLAGVQYKLDDCPVDRAVTEHTPEAGLDCIRAQDSSVGTCLGMDPNYYMANFVVESDPFLNNFSGPGFGKNPFSNCKNTVYQGKQYNMGGCKGCHGVAQTAFGTDFSFLLDFNGKPVAAPDVINPPSGNASKAARKPGFPTQYLDRGKGRGKH
jgi:hypothetical protein